MLSSYGDEIMKPAQIPAIVTEVDVIPPEPYGQIRKHDAPTALVMTAVEGVTVNDHAMLRQFETMVVPGVFGVIAKGIIA
jgi:hypothetical protein